jgi:hypothetical protein
MINRDSHYSRIVANAKCLFIKHNRIYVLQNQTAESECNCAGGCCGIKFLTLVCRLQNCSNELAFRRHLLNSKTLKLYLLGPSVSVTINHQQRLFSFIFKSVKNPTRRVVPSAAGKIPTGSLPGLAETGPCTSFKFSIHCCPTHSCCAALMSECVYMYPRQVCGRECVCVCKCVSRGPKSG